MGLVVSGIGRWAFDSDQVRISFKKLDACCSFYCGVAIDIQKHVILELVLLSMVISLRNILFFTSNKCNKHT